MNFTQYKFNHHAALATCLLLAATATVRADDSASPVTATISIDNFSFSPDTLTVKAGTTVTWVNHDDIPHTVVSADTPRLFKSPPMDTDGHYSYTFSAPGSFRYFCSIHPHMVGQVIVK